MQNNKLEVDQAYEEKVAALARHYQHIGYVLYGSIALILAGFLLYNVITALTH